MPTASPLDPDELARGLSGLSGWTLDEGMVVKSFSFPNYHQTIGFVNAIAWVANRSNHHPDLEVSYGKVTVKYRTHDAGGITEADIDAAREVDTLI